MEISYYKMKRIVSYAIWGYLIIEKGMSVEEIMKLDEIEYLNYYKEFQEFADFLYPNE